MNSVIRHCCRRRTWGCTDASDCPDAEGNELIGAFTVYRQEVRPFTDKQIELVDKLRRTGRHRHREHAAAERTAQEVAAEQQTATSEVLKVISSSPGDLQPVFEAMLENAVRICDAKFGNIFRWDGDAFRLVATHNVPAEFRRSIGGAHRFVPPEQPSVVCSQRKAAIHVADLAADPGYIERCDRNVAAVELGGARTASSCADAQG